VHHPQVARRVAAKRAALERDPPVRRPCRLGVELLVVHPMRRMGELADAAAGRADREDRLLAAQAEAAVAVAVGAEDDPRPVWRPARVQVVLTDAADARRA